MATRTPASTEAAGHRQSQRVFPGVFQLGRLDFQGDGSVRQVREVGILDTPRANRTSVFEPFDFDRLCGQRLVQRGFLRLLLDIDGRLGRDLGAVGLVATILYVPLSLTGSADAISSSSVPSGNNRMAIRLFCRHFQWLAFVHFGGDWEFVAQKFCRLAGQSQLSCGRRFSYGASCPGRLLHETERR